MVSLTRLVGFLLVASLISCGNTCRERVQTPQPPDDIVFVSSAASNLPLMRGSGIRVDRCLPAGTYRLQVVQTDSPYACAAIWESTGSWVEGSTPGLCQISAAANASVREFASHVNPPRRGRVPGLQHLDVQLAETNCDIVLKVLLPRSAWEGESNPRVVLRKRVTDKDLQVAADDALAALDRLEWAVQVHPGDDDLELIELVQGAKEAVRAVREQTTP